MLMLAACGGAADPNVTELTYATQYAPTHPFSRADIAWMQFVERRSAGRLRVRPIWSGTLLSSDMSMEELRHGVADIGLITPIYVRGGSHLIRIQSGFYSGVPRIEDQVSLYNCIAAANPQIGHELEGLKVLAVQGGSLPGIVTRDRPIRTLEDLRGLRIRAPTELLTLLRELGADPVNMPMGEVYQAMAKRIIDGVIAPADTFRALHFSEVAHFYSNLSVPRGAYPARAMGIRRWNALTPEQRQILEESIPVWEAALARENRAALDRGFAEARAHNVTFTSVPPQDQARFESLYLHDAEQNARAMERLGIDGLAAFRSARNSVRPDGSIACARS
jgi:TRAP-type C4-dicarboxylate transport system substrate-binding protein